jgi:DivIVA domain-containing protein
VPEEQPDERPQQDSLPAATVRKLKRSPGRPRRESLVPEVQAKQFPIVFRGYEKEAVDGFLSELAAQIAELETTQSSDAVIKSALEEVGEQTGAILRQAHESADEITRRSRARADDRLREAEAEAEKIVAEAERRARELDSDAERIWDERQRLIDDLRQLAEETLRVADESLERFEPPLTEEPAAAAEEPPAVEDPTVAIDASDAEEAPQRDPAPESRDGDAGEHQDHDQ